MDEDTSIGIPGGHSDSSCGYCSPPGERSAVASSHHSATLDVIRLSCKVYQKMIDRGWRRSGAYCYKPDLRRSCCPQYTIKLDASVFKPSKSQRKLVNRWNRFMLHGKSDESMEVDSNKSKGSHGPKPKNRAPFSLSKGLHASEISFNSEDGAAHRFEVILEPSSYTKEKFELYRKYQTEIHHDRHNSPSGFKRFLVDSPLVAVAIPYPSPPPSHLPTSYGSYHQLYKVDGELIAMGVLDILPNCVSSVYFMYDKSWEEFSLGKLSALREISLAREMCEAGAPGMGYLYMGFYIHTCQKMRYKGEYSPSYLADPETYEWYPLATCTPALDKYRYACFSHLSHSIDGDAADSNSTSGVDSEKELVRLAGETRVLGRNESGELVAIPTKETTYWVYDSIRRAIGECAYGLGEELIQDFVFSI